MEIQPGRIDTLVSRVTNAGMRSRTEVLRASSSGIPGMKAGSIQLMNGDDSTMAITYVDTARHAYAEMKPGAMLSQLGGVKMITDSSADSSSVDSLGPGPVVAGYNTLHFRTRTTSRTTMVMMGDSMTRSDVTIRDIYVAPALKNEAAGKTDRDSTFMRDLEVGMPGLAHTAARLRDQMRRVDQAGYPVMTDTDVISTTEMGKSERHTKTEVLSYAKRNIPASAFVVPAGYRKVGFMDLLMPN